MKRICFPATARPHLARQALLLAELKKSFEVDIFQPTTKHDGSMAIFAIFCAVEFNNYLARNDFDAVIIRGDRFELLGLAMVASYRGIPIIHIEGGDLSGVIDNRVRGAITNLADLHFCTNDESHARLINAGVPIDKVWNFGSLDVEFALEVKPERIIDHEYILVSYHPFDGEDESNLEAALKDFTDFDIIKTTSNKDYGKEYGNESYSPEDYINLMRFAGACVGNSSAFLKEASVLEVPVVNVGKRQNKRLKPMNVMDVPCSASQIVRAIKFQLGMAYGKDLIYFKSNTSKNIAAKIKELI